MIVKDPNAIVRVKNHMTGEESHIIHVTPDKQREYHIPAGGIAEMRWKDFVHLTQQYPQSNRYLKLDESTIITDDGEILISGEKSEDILALEDIHQMTILPELAFTKLVQSQSRFNLTRIREVAETKERSDLVAILDSLLLAKNDEEGGEKQE